jgi:hypothetical protein
MAVGQREPIGSGRVLSVMAMLRPTFMLDST